MAVNKIFIMLSDITLVLHNPVCREAEQCGLEGRYLTSREAMEMPCLANMYSYLKLHIS